MQREAGAGAVHASAEYDRQGWRKCRYGREHLLIHRQARAKTREQFSARKILYIKNGEREAPRQSTKDH